MATVGANSAGSSFVSGAQRSDKEKDGTRQPSSPSPDGISLSQKKIVEVACWACRRRKGKCTGERPSCSSCVRRGVDCEYEYGEGLTRLGSLRQELHHASTRAEDLQYLFDQLRSRTDNESACLLAIIRLGVDIDIIVKRLRAEPDLAWTSSPEFHHLLPK